MSIREGVRGFTVIYRDAYGRKQRAHAPTRDTAVAIEQTLTAQVRITRAQVKNFQRREALTISQAFTAWMSARVLCDRTRINDQRRVLHFTLRYASRLAHEVSPQIIAEHLNNRAQAVAPGTLYQEARLLKNFFAWCKEQCITPTDPASGVQLRAVNRSPGFSLTAAQETQLLTVWSPRSRLKALLALDAGMARADIHSLTRAQIDFAQRTISYYRVKTRVFALIPLTRRLETEILRVCSHCTDPHARLFKAKPGSGHSLTRAARARLDFDFRFHDLRHTFISKVARTGARNRIVQALAAHAPQTVTERYEHPELTELREVITAMERGVRLIAAEPPAAQAPGETEP